MKTAKKRSAPGAAGALTMVALAAALLAACTGSPPEILEVLWEVRIERDRDSGLFFQALSVFVKPHDPDGSDDLEELYLIHDDQELFWRLDADTWVQSGSGQDLWIGSNAFRLPDGSRLPAGEYRILLRDAGGEAAEQTIRVDTPSLEEARRYLPEVSITREAIRLAPADRAHTLWLYGPDQAVVASVEVPRGGQPLPALRAGYPALQSGFRFKVYTRIEALNLGVIVGPYAVEP